QSVMPAYSADVLCDTADRQLVVKLMSDPDKLNNITVKEGRMPEKSGECLADTAFIVSTGLSVGDTVQVKSGTEDAIGDTLHTDTFTIVGTGSTSYYLSLDRGSSSIGSGDIDSFLIIPQNDFSMEVYTEICLKVEGADDLDSYTEEYDDYVEEIVKKIEEISGSRAELRYQSVVTEANDKIAEGEQEIADAKKELSDAGQELADAKQELLDGEEELADGKQKITDAKQEIKDKEQEIKDAEQELADAKVELADALTELKDGKSEIEENEQKLQDGRAEIMRNKEKLRDGEQQLKEGKATLTQKEEELLAGKNTLMEQETALNGLQGGYPSFDPAETNQIPACQSFLNGFASYLSAGGMTPQALSESTGGQIPVSFFEDLTNPSSDIYKDVSEWALWLPEERQGRAAELAALHRFSGSYISTALSTVAEKKIEIAAGEEQLAAAGTEILGKEKELAEGWDKIHEAEYEILDGEAKLADAKKEWTDGYQEYEDGLLEYEDGRQELEDGKIKMADGRKELADKEQELLDGEKELEEGKLAYADGEEEYLDAKAEADAELADANEEIADAREKVKDLKVPEWYVLDRNYIQTYVEYGQDSDRIGAIGEVFPVIFFLVAALVALTTMTRMVEEERTQIGTLKALGYSNGNIAAKYLLYALSASLSGSIAGLVIGQKLLPYVIINAYAILYNNLTTVLTPLNMEYSVSATLVAISCTTLATLFACYKELAATPAVLMRPSAPKAGKRVFLERIPFIWKKLNFTQKSTIRNLIRYKKRFFMTIFGIGGCMGLLLVGFGVKDSISSIGEYQFGQIRTYDADITIEEKATEEEKASLIDKLASDKRIVDYLYGKQSAIDIKANDTVKSGYLIVPSDNEKVKDYICFRNRLTKEAYTLNDNGVIISEKLAKLLDVGAGDKILLQEDDTAGVEVVIEEVTENYFLHYVYMSSGLYEEVYGEKPVYSEIFLNTVQNDKEFEGGLGTEYLEMNAVAGMTFYSEMADRIDNMLTSMNTVIYVLVVSAGLLAFVVLYNLNNININERKRELATLKVLGFYDREVDSYVNRENIILTLIGAVFGIFIGFFLHRFVILTAEIDLMMFGREIKPVSYLYSILLTFAFSFIVNAVMSFRLKKIDMVESLKSVE
ncbi:MAG: FtsX-like permease family protein, partial [Lachnospiraceae bacterium]